MTTDDIQEAHRARSARAPRTRPGSNGQPPSPTAGWARPYRVDAPWASSDTKVQPDRSDQETRPSRPVNSGLRSCRSCRRDHAAVEAIADVGRSNTSSVQAGERRRREPALSPQCGLTGAEPRRKALTNQRFHWSEGLSTWSGWRDLNPRPLPRFRGPSLNLGEAGKTRVHLGCYGRPVDFRLRLYRVDSGSVPVVCRE